MYLRPTKTQRALLAVPIGDLLEVEPELAAQILASKYLKGSKGIAFSVGDVVTETLLKANIPFSVGVLDLKTKRRPLNSDLEGFQKMFFLKNPAGHINLEAWEVFRSASAAGPKSLVLVDGEEDLLTLVAIDLAEDGSLVVYGQPERGMAVVAVDPSLKKRIRELISSFPLVHSPVEEKP